MDILIGVILLAVLLGSIFLLMKEKNKNKLINEELESFKMKYQPILNVQQEVDKLKQNVSSLYREISTLKSDYKTKKDIFDDLQKQVNIYQEDLELVDVGFYSPKFDFDDSEIYKQEILKVKELQKSMMSDKTAITCAQDWSIEGSKSKGKAMINRNIRLVARAFNNECDVIISKVRWNNVEKSEERMFRMYDSINKLVESLSIVIDRKYLDFKIRELTLTHEYREKKQDEKEEQAQIRQQMREEAKLEQEIVKAEQEEEKYAKLLEKAKRDAEKATGAKLDGLHTKMAELEAELSEAHSKNERAKSMAQQTRAGHVYVISNIGSFGENVYKIGMTRRLEPMDRVKELGDASVPFVFDVHAMIYSEDAPSMEKALHRVFEGKRVNLVNSRKEFFSVSLEEVKEEVLNHKSDVEFIETIEAKEYRESAAIRSKKEEKVQIKEEFPSSI